MLLASLQFAAGLGEQSTLDSVAQTANFLPDVNNATTQKFTHNDGIATSNVTLTTAASTTGNPGVNLDILSQGSVAKNGIASVGVNAGASNTNGTIGPTVNIPVTIVATDPDETAGDPVSVQFSFAFNVEKFASNNATATFAYAANFSYNGTTTSLASKVDNLGGDGVITPIGPGPVDNETGILLAKIGDTFTLSLSENLVGQIASTDGDGLSNVGWLVDTNLDVSLGDLFQPTMLQWHPDKTAIWNVLPELAGGVDFGYGAPELGLPPGADVVLYWASGDVKLSGPINTGPDNTPQPISPGGEEDVRVAASQLGTPPPGTTDLLLTADPDVGDDTLTLGVSAQDVISGVSVGGSLYRSVKAAAADGASMRCSSPRAAPST